MPMLTLMVVLVMMVPMLGLHDFIFIFYEFTKNKNDAVIDRCRVKCNTMSFPPSITEAVTLQVAFPLHNFFKFIQIFPNLELT